LYFQIVSVLAQALLIGLLQITPSCLPDKTEEN